MSFFRNLRSSITRGRSSSRDTTPVRNSRPGSVISSFNSGSSKRRDSIESRSDSLLNRSETFILDEPDVITPSHSNCSTLEKKSKKSKVLEKFSTFTKRKKNPPQEDSSAFEHHPSDNATNTYYKWQAEGGGNSLDYDSQNDPFNFLYEQQSSLKSLHNAGDSLKSTTAPSANTFDSSTFRKSKMPTDLKKQLKKLKDQDSSNRKNDVKQKVQETADEYEEAEEDEDRKTDKYKTVTLNSFRRSFREKFLQQQKDAAYNPAWFVQVETPETNKSKQDQRDSSKENRRDLLVFENDNYRPGSRSPIRDFNKSKEVRNSTRSPVKRNETFRVERLSRLDEHANKSEPKENTTSIHIEFKNSITPHIPGRMVPVGVAKPMPSQFNYTNYYRKIEPTPQNTAYTSKLSAGTSKTRINNHSPFRSSSSSSWLKPHSPARPVNSNPTRPGRYQTLVQIKNEKSQQAPPITVRNSRLSTRIQLGSNSSLNPDKKASTTSNSSSFGKRYNSCQLLSNSGTKTQPLKQTYFGDTLQSTRITQIPLSINSTTSGLRIRQAGTPTYSSYKYHTPSSLFASTNSLTPAAPASASATISSRSTPSHSVNNIYSSSSSSNNNNNLSYLKLQRQHHPMQQHQQQQQQTRFLATGQRRSRSPIKVPWR